MASLAIDMNGAVTPGKPNDFATAIGFRGTPTTRSSEIRIRDIRIYDGTGVNDCCPHGILLLETDRAWIERNHLTHGYRIKAGGGGSRITIEGNYVEDANDNAITLLDGAPDSTTEQYAIRHNVVRNAFGASIVIGADGVDVPGQVVQDILIDGNLVRGPLAVGQSGIAVKIEAVTRRIHLTNNVISNAGPMALFTTGISVANQNSPGFAIASQDILVSNNTLVGPFDHAGIYVTRTDHAIVSDNRAVEAGSRGIWVGGANGVKVSGNLVTDSARGLTLEDSRGALVVDNVLRGQASGSDGLLVLTSDASKSVGAVVASNSVTGWAGAGIAEQGVGSFDTHYLFNDLRDNAGGAFSTGGASTTLLGNLGSSDYVGRHSSATATLDFGAMAAPGCALDLAVGVPGARGGDTVVIGAPAPSVASGTLFFGWVSSSDVVSLRACAFAGNPNPPAGTFRVDVWGH